MAFQNELDEWIQLAKTCQYLPENDLKVRFFNYDFKIPTTS